MTLSSSNGFVYATDLLVELPDIPADSILNRTLYDDEQVRVILFGFAAGQELSEHTASMVAILHFLEGEADVTLGQEERVVRPGTWVMMQPNLPHSIHARTRVVMLLTMIKG